MNIYTIEGAKRQIVKNRIISGSFLGLVSIFEALSIARFVNEAKGEEIVPTSFLLLYFVSLLWFILFIIFLTYLASNKLYYFTYKDHKITAYSGGRHHVTFLDGKFVSDYGVVWWQHTSVVRIDNDMVCIKFGPIGVHQYARPNFYSNSTSN